MAHSSTARGLAVKLEGLESEPFEFKFDNVVVNRFSDTLASFPLFRHTAHQP